jgi:hypothetical protein
MNQNGNDNSDIQEAVQKPNKLKKARQKPLNKPKGKRTRKNRIYPALPFEVSLKLGEAIHQLASGERVNRLTLFKALDKSPTSSANATLITSSAKYGITVGSYVADYLDFTEKGKLATDPSFDPIEKARIRFELAIENIEPFKILYAKYKNKRLPSFDILSDVLKEAKLDIDDHKECIEIFMVNCKYLGLLQTIAGVETLLSVEAVLEEIQKSSGTPIQQDSYAGADSSAGKIQSGDAKVNWENECFYITPIGDDGSEYRKHSDLFLSSLIEPALKDLKLKVIRADRILEPGMITAQALEHIVNAKLVIVDLSFHNPNVFYEMAIRHSCKLPVIQICRKSDKIPFDVNQVRTIIIDTTDIYTLIPKLDYYRAEISTQARSALDGQLSSNPVSIYLPKHGLELKPEKTKLN